MPGHVDVGGVRSGLERLRARPRGDLQRGDDGFTLLEMIVAISILAVTLVSLSYAMFGGMRVLQAGRHKTTFLELANKAAEEVRALDYQYAGVSLSDSSIGEVYDYVGPGLYDYKFQGRDAVVLEEELEFVEPGQTVRAYEDFGPSSFTNRPPHKIWRAVTYTDPTGGALHRFKRIDVTIQWNEANGQVRSVSYNTLYYPGNLGADLTVPTPPSFTVSPETGVVNSDFFVAISSAKPELSYTWDWGDGTTSVGASPPGHNYQRLGSYTISVVATAASGASSTPANRTVTVGTPRGFPAPPFNVPPVARFTVDTASGVGPLSITVDATSSSDANCDQPGNCDPLTYQWNWGDLTATGSGVSAGHKYINGGTYTLTLLVTDPAGDQSSATATITVTSTTCYISAAQFKNPSSNDLVNDILVGKSQRPKDTQFKLSATTTAACTRVDSLIPNQASGGFKATLSLLSANSQTKTWGITISNNDRYITGSSQGGSFTAFGPVVTSDFPITYSVHQ